MIWYSIVLSPAREPRFRGLCYFCGKASASGCRRLRVPKVGPAGSGPSDYVKAPSFIDVPSCGACRWRARRLTGAVFLLAISFPLVAGERDKFVEPLIPLPPSVRIVLALIAVGMLCFVAFGNWATVDVSHQARGMCYAFTDVDVAGWFAADNDARIEDPFAAPPAAPPPIRS